MRRGEVSRNDHEAAEEEETAVSAIRALMAGVIDYAGLFPPASLSLADAVASFDAYRRGDDAWALGRFVVPAARLAELAGEIAPRLAPSGAARPFRISALLGDDLAADLERVRAFNDRIGGGPGKNGAAVDAVELKAGSEDDIARARAILAREMEAYVELPVAGDPGRLVGAVGRAGMRAKVRTGGVTTDAFPEPADLTRFIASCVDAAVPFKATAGLHHPVRAEYRLTYAAASPTACMYGFLNLLLAAALLRAGASSAHAMQALEETDAHAIEFDDGGVSWRGRRVGVEQLAALRRDGAIAFGSCSFEEPLADLRRLALV
jgi:hypothetical protein